MPREVKFRGKTLKTNKWIYGDLIQNKEINNYQIIDYTSYGKEILKDTIGQFTGLHDKNGKEIYEGDIVKFKHRDITITAPVKYGEWQESKCCEYDCSHYGYYIDYKWDNYCENTGFDLYEEIVEVIGNIYENSDLLKGADNIE